MSECHSASETHHVERTIGGTTVVILRGQVDLVTQLSLTARVDALTAGPRPDLVLDLRPVSFIDCAGLGLLCRARNRVAAGDGRLRLVSDSASFRRLLQLTGLAGVFEVHPDLDGARLVGSAPRQRPAVPTGRGRPA
ncbi:STAS domain-containing protein [Streptomyces sp. NPDC046197]|uniref:STAS domain-containing protein n=1 Tax=Streptomyces sp. NPDC046197 TaxID=3154337 RepID=UPI0033E89B9B